MGDLGPGLTELVDIDSGTRLVLRREWIDTATLEPSGNVDVFAYPTDVTLEPPPKYVGVSERDAAPRRAVIAAFARLRHEPTCVRDTNAGVFHVTTVRIKPDRLR